MTKSGFIGTVLIIAFVFLAISIYSIFASLDQNSTLPWAKRFIWMWIGFAIIIGCYSIMILLVIRWFNCLCKFKFIHSTNSSTPDSIVNFHISEGLSVNEFRNPRFVLELTSNTGSNDYRKLSISEAPINPESMIKHASYVYLIKPFTETRKELLSKNESEEELMIDFQNILKSPNILNPLLYVSVGGLLWSIVAWGLLLSFSILMTIKLDDDLLTWNIVFIPVYCFLGLPVVLWIIAFIHPRNKTSRYRWYMIGWLFDMVRSHESKYRYYTFVVLSYICASVISVSFLVQYLDDLTPDTDFIYGIFLPQVGFFGFMFCWMFFWITLPKIVSPTSRSRYSFHIVFFLLIVSGLATTFFVLLWIRVQWTTFAWSWTLIPFISLCGFIAFSIMYTVMNYMQFVNNMDHAMDEYLLGNIPIHHTPSEIGQTNITGSESLLPDVTTEKKETL